MTDWRIALENDLTRQFRAPDNNRCVASAEFFAFVADQLSRQERGSFERHLVGCFECSDQLQLLGQATTLWEAAGNRETRSAERRRSSWLTPWRLALVAVAAVLALAMAWLIGFTPNGEEQPVFRIKGSWTVHVAAKRGGATFRVNDGTRLNEGDRLGFFFSGQRPAHLVVLYLDREQAVPLVPAAGAESLYVEAGEESSLPDGALITQGKGCEWIVSVFAHEPFSVQEAKDAALRMLDARDGCQLNPNAAKMNNWLIQILEVER